MRKLILFFIIILLNSCSAIHVNRNINVGVSKEVKQEFIKAEKRIRKERRKTKIYHIKHRVKYNNLQNKKL